MILPENYYPKKDKNPTEWEVYASEEPTDLTDNDKLQILHLLIFKEKITHQSGTFNILFNMLIELKFYSLAMAISIHANDYWNYHIAGIYKGLFDYLPKQLYVNRLKSLNLNLPW